MPSSFAGALNREFLKYDRRSRRVGNKLGLAILQDGEEGVEGLEWGYGAADEEGEMQEEQEEDLELQKEVVVPSEASPSLVDHLDSFFDPIEDPAKDIDEALDAPPTLSTSTLTSIPKSTVLASTPQQQPKSSSTFFQPFVAAASLFDSTSTAYDHSPLFSSSWLSFFTVSISPPPSSPPPSFPPTPTGSATAATTSLFRSPSTSPPPSSSLPTLRTLSTTSALPSATTRARTARTSPSFSSPRAAASRAVRQSSHSSSPSLLATPNPTSSKSSASSLAFNSATRRPGTVDRRFGGRCTSFESC